MSKCNKKTRKNSLRGSALFTVLAVMLVMIIIVMTTIALAGIASKKAYSTWFDNQTKYTAQSLVDNVVKSFQPSSGKPEDIALGKQILSQTMNKNDKVTLNVDFTDASGKAYGNYGQVQSLVFENVGTTADFKFDDTVAGSATKQILKVTAIVNMGGETSTYSTYVTGDYHKTSSSSSPGGFIAKAENKENVDAPSIWGRSYTGITNTPDKATLTNQSSAAGDIFYNVGKLTTNASVSNPLMYVGRNDPVANTYSGLAVTGDLELQGVVNIVSQYNMTDMTNETVNNFPYIYADNITLGNGAQLKVVDGPLNIFCNTFDANQTGRHLSGNINYILMSETGSSKIGFEGTALTRWAGGNLTSGTSDYYAKQTGNVYCKGNLEKVGNGGVIDGDLVVMGNLKVNGSLEVKGTVCVGGTIDGTVTCANQTQKIKTEPLPGDTEGNLLYDQDKGAGKDKVVDFDEFCAACDSKLGGLGARFKDIFSLKKSMPGTTGEYDMVQTLDNIKKSYLNEKGTDESGNPIYTYKGVVDKSLLANSDAADWTGQDTINTSDSKYYLWGYTAASKNKLGSTADSDKMIININPGKVDMWINISKDVDAINHKMIIVDDSEGGSVRFFLEDRSGAANKTLKLEDTYIVTKKYYDMIFDSSTWASVKSGAKLELSTYPEERLVPHIFIYGGTGNDTELSLVNNSLITGDIVVPDGSFKSNASCLKIDTVDYTVQTYDTSTGSINSNNQITISESNKPIRVIGSLELAKQDVNNIFGYLYVDDPPGGDGGGLDTDEYSWSMANGYSAY